MYGEEPAKLGEDFIASDLNMHKALTWYNSMSEVKSLRKYFEKWSQYNPSILKASDKDIPITACAISKLIVSKCKLPKKYIEYLERKVQELETKYGKEEVKIIPLSDYRINETEADIEDILDIFYRSNYKPKQIDLFKILKETNARPNEVRSCVTKYKELLEEVVEHRDDLIPKSKKNYIALLNNIIDDCNSYLSNNRNEKKLIRKPRKKKIKSAEQLASKVQFKISDDMLKLTSVHPSKIIGSSEVWIYNTKYKRLSYLSGSLNIKGTTIIGFDDKSLTKTIRKPEINLAKLLDLSKISMLKQFKELKTKPIVANGRLNKDCLILKAHK